MGDQEQEERARARIGTTVRNKYRIDSLLGMGGMAVVYVATPRNQMEFAIKMLHPELSMSGDLKTRFLREGYAANSVKHPGVVQVVDDDVAEDGSAFLVMERLHGAGLDSLCEKHGVLGVSDAMGILDQLLDVLGAAHEKNIVHRDIKPANLFLTRDGTLKVLDFGIARARDAMATGSGATGTGVLMGTPAFMAPEQALAKTSEIDGRTDLWAAGATLFTLVVGSFVHQGDNAPQLLVQAATTRARSLATALPTAHPSVVDFVDRSLAFERESRFPNAAAMQAALRAAHQLAFGALPPRQSLVGGGSTRPAPITPFIAVTQALPSAPTTGQANGPSSTNKRRRRRCAESPQSQATPQSEAR